MKRPGTDIDAIGDEMRELVVKHWLWLVEKLPLAGSSSPGSLAHHLFQGRQCNRVDDGLMVMEEAAPKRATRQEDRQNGDHTHY
jgi:hypothetical protein